VTIQKARSFRWSLGIAGVAAHDFVRKAEAFVPEELA